MPAPVCHVLIPDRPDRAIPFVVPLFETSGLSVKNPHTGKITTWNEDGTQEEIAEAQAYQLIAGGHVQNIQFWKTASDDVFVSWEERADGCMLSIFLDGVSADLADGLVGLFTRSALTTFREKYGETIVLTFSFQ